VGPPLRKDQARALAVAVAAGRVAIGLAALAAPSALARPWVGAGEDPGRRVLARALGGRDLALGLGGLLAARRGRPLRGWVEAGGLADAGDVVATLLALRHLPPRSSRGVLVVAAGAAAAAFVAAPGVDAAAAVAPGRRRLVRERLRRGRRPSR
jgi:hypothetical protein